MADWKIFERNADPHDRIAALPRTPPWRDFQNEDRRAKTYQASDHEVEMVNAALYLRRPLLVTGTPGIGKSSLIHAVAHQLKLGPVLVWSISSHSTVRDGLYEYDAIGRLRDANLRPQKPGTPVEPEAEAIARYLRLGPLGTALLPGSRPRALLVDELDKADVDFPNNLLHVFEEGSYEIPELVRIAETYPEVKLLPSDKKAKEDRVAIKGGRVQCTSFPFVVLTSNGERDMPPAFLRRCLRLEMKYADDRAERERFLREIVAAHFTGEHRLATGDKTAVEEMVGAFLERQDEGRVVATDQLLNAIYLLKGASPPQGEERARLVGELLHELGEGG